MANSNKIDKKNETQKPPDAQEAADPKDAEKLASPEKPAESKDCEKSK